MEDNIWGDSVGITLSNDAEKPVVARVSTSTDDKLKLVRESVTKLNSFNADQLSMEQRAWMELAQFITDESNDEEYTTFTQLASGIGSKVNDKTMTGFSLIHYIIIYDRPNYIELLCSKHDHVDLNGFDDIAGYSPLMWCFYLQRKDCCIELFNLANKINFQLRNKDGLSAWDLASKGSAMYIYLQQNDMLRYSGDISQNIITSSGFGSGSNTFNMNDDDTTNINDNIDLQIASMNLSSNNELDNGTNTLYKENPMYGNEDLYQTYNASNLEDFDFFKLKKYQYLEFSNYDIPQILEFLVNLPKTHPHMTTYPAALLYQCARYADVKKKSKSETESLLFLAFTKIGASISNANNLDNVNETSGKDDDKNKMSNNNPSNEEHNKNENSDSNEKKKPRQTVDIVTQSYWISALTFLYYYLTKDELFFKNHPNILQELINVLHSIIIELVSSIHSRLEPLIRQTLLNYTTIEDVKQTLYKRDWNFFKKRKQAKLALKEKNKKIQKQAADLEKSKSNETENNSNNTNDSDGASDNEDDDSVPRQAFDTEILKHLYPPSFEEQMKPSPMKIVQIFGALSYVLNLHQIHPLFQQQCLSTAMKWFSTTVFNLVLKDKKKKILSRARAIQIRLNLSTLESWIRNNDLNVPKPKLIDDFMWERFPTTLIQNLAQIDLNNPILHSITTYKPIESAKNIDQTVTDENNSLFYYQSFHQIAYLHLEPLFQVLQWLQVATTLENEEALDNTLELLPQLTPAQLLKAIDKYNYEVNEHKFSSKLRKKLSNLSKLSGTKITYLEEKQIPLLCLPTVTELSDTFAHDRETLPFLPDDIQDIIYDIHDENRKLRMNDIDFEEENATEEESEENRNMDNIVPSNANTVIDNNHTPDDDEEGLNTVVKEPSDNIFDSINVPATSVAQPSWGSSVNDEMDANPW